MADDINKKAVTRGVLEALSDKHLVLALPHTDYRIHLVPAVDARGIKTAIGKRIQGTIEAKALRVHPASGGGRFIEPVAGEPRIVSGTVLAIDKPARRVLINAAMPMWMTTTAEQDFSVFESGTLVNCYVESGVTFTPVDGDH